MASKVGMEQTAISTRFVSSGPSSNSPLKTAVLNRSMKSSVAQSASRRAKLLAAPPRATYPSSNTVAKSGTPVFESAAGQSSSIQTNQERQTRGKRTRQRERGEKN